MLNIVMIASECVPFAKTGGLADVVGALPPALSVLGHRVVVIIPKYGFVDSSLHPMRPLPNPLGVRMGNMQEWCAVHEASLPGKVPVYLIEHDLYFGRPGLYHDAALNDYVDNPRRFSLLARAGLQLCQDLPFRPDVVHVHDWQTALATAYLKVWHWDSPILGPAGSLLTIHNIGYQGKYPSSHYEYIGLGWPNFEPDILEDYGQINFLKGGIHYADLVNTVSPTYANETRTPGGGMGLAPYLNNKGDRYIGILNGVDYTHWDPSADPLIPAAYSATDLAGKSVCKRALQDRMGLQVEPQVPLVGVISRFAHQKGLDVLAQVVDGVLQQMVVQFAVLGSGDPALETFFGALPGRYPGRAASVIGYDNELAHWIEAGADFFLMPSRYEPCGLNQLYSLRYGTLPIVRATGGLADTVEQYDQSTAAGTGFKFWDLTAQALHDTIGWAVSTYFDRPHHLLQLVRRAMSRDFSWEQSALGYQAAYLRAMEIKRGR